MNGNVPILDRPKTAAELAEYSQLADDLLHPKPAEQEEGLRERAGHAIRRLLAEVAEARRHVRTGAALLTLTFTLAAGCVHSPGSVAGSHVLVASAVTPSPGSPTARARGCRCPTVINASGAGACRDRMSRLFWIVEGCPLHGGRRD